MTEAGRKVKEAGISSSVTIILGLGGIEGSAKHALETARALTQIDSDYVGALTLTLVPGTPLYEQWERNEFHPLSPFQSLEELKSIIENSDFSNCFFSSMHASNYLSVRGKLPQDRDRMLKQLEKVLAARDSALLRPEFLRGL
jgi:radical SAM superfamily enzyme